MFQTCIRPYNLPPSASRLCVSHDKVNSPCTYHTDMSIPTAHCGPSLHSLAAMSTIKTLTVPKPSRIISPLFHSFLLIWRFPILLALGLAYHKSDLFSVPKYPSISHTTSSLSFATMWAPPTPPWAANPPPDQERHEGYYPGTSTSVIGVGLFATILSVIVVCMRLYSRVFSVRGLKADDRESRSHANIPHYQWPLG